MQSNQPQFHGSDLETIAAYYHISQNDIINYSSNVNPVSYTHLILLSFYSSSGSGASTS